MTKVKNVWTRIKLKMHEFLTPIPEVEEEYVDKVVYLLRRDFDTETQNILTVKSNC
jgi:hypothetical protein